MIGALIQFISISRFNYILSAIEAVICHPEIEVNPFPNDKILDLSKLKEFADDNFQFDENDVKFSKNIVNTVGKGEIARYEQFLLFPQCFPKTCTADT